MCRLYFRNTYKNCKIMILYAFLAILFLLISTFCLMFSFIVENKILMVFSSIISFILCVFIFFILCLKNNDYKLKHVLNLKQFKKEYSEYEKVLEGNPKSIKHVKNCLKDNFLRFGTINNPIEENYALSTKDDVWNNWIEDQSAFNYGNSQFSEKLSFLIYVLYNAADGGSGFEGFFQTLSYEQPYFKFSEVKDVLFRDKFLSDGLKSLLIKIIDEFSYDKQDELYAKYEQIENNELFKYDEELFNCCVWLSYNGNLLSNCAGIYANTGNLIIRRMFLSKDYKNRIYIYEDDNKKIRYANESWINIDFEGKWISQMSNNSIFETEELAFNDCKHLIKDYIELDM